ncbi:Asp-tRNAAsn/Glu-tRNAGln amidotransferase A subunit [Enhydrobacter aerosaccus]|uniref:Asp-tRNAAsn/Glu-tRNAGln amidotransferase A subunit n=1 Tax=Enhydrobacter aerosaccus TaxID=225324 RepID=A0A1T4TBW4_9HYPH|nr:amidase [Enhydrobacter aerosaccus]SKA37982.1 Asp-tRNAAsn/Glu-tRNAGln amidotransferase A subunit [Enhydrobacter aerosaccus]
MSAPNTLTATEIARQIDAGTLSAEAVLRAHLDRIDQRDADVLAWSHLARDAALEKAKALDRGPRKGLLHGVPMGVKDIIDSYDQPTGYGSPIYKTHQPLADAATVALARDAGAILLGKTVTTEFANRFPGPTRNPHNPAHTPGGSSSGSAAAVADYQVTLATGTQTGGSVIRPAAFCGIVGYKPTYGHFPTAGMKANTEWLDTIGAYARSLDDIALFRAALMAIPYRPIEAPLSPPRIAVCYTHHKAELSPEGRAAVESAAAALAKAGAKVTEIDLPAPVSDMTAGQKTLSAFDGPRAHADEARRFQDLLSKSLREDKLAAGAKIDHTAWTAARRLGEHGRAAVDALFDDIDVILTAPAPGEAPVGLGFTGHATFNLLWTYLWMPCVTLPFTRGPNGLPVGIQLVGRQHEDARLLDLAAWVQGALR